MTNTLAPLCTTLAPLPHQFGDWWGVIIVVFWNLMRKCIPQTIRKDQLIGSMGQFRLFCWLRMLGTMNIHESWIFTMGILHKWSFSSLGKSSMDFPASAALVRNPRMTSSGRNLQPAGCQSSKVYIAVGCATARHFQVPSGAGLWQRWNCAGAIQEVDLERLGVLESWILPENCQKYILSLHRNKKNPRLKTS